MKTSTLLEIELPRIKRIKNSWPGKVIYYLINHPSGNPSWELAVEAIAAYWLVEALENEVERQQLIIASRSAREKLEGKLATIRKIITGQLTVDSSYTDIKNEENENLYAELPRIRRAKNSWEGKVIQYLLQSPSNKPAAELMLEAITAYWLVEALLENNAEYSAIVKGSRMSLEKLEAKLTTIERIVGNQTLQPTLSRTQNILPNASNQAVDAPKPDSTLNLELGDEETSDVEADDEDWSDFLDEETRLLASVLGS